MIVATVAPHLNTFSILSILERCCIRYRCVEGVIIEYGIAQVLPENAHVRLPVQLPYALILLRERLWSSEYTDAACLAVEPIAFKRAAIGPEKLAVAAFRVIIADYLTLSSLVLIPSRLR